MTPDIAVAMVTVDRSPAENYLRGTLENLVRGGVWTSPRLRDFVLCDSGSGGNGWLIRSLPDAYPVPLHYSGPVNERRCANQNVARALRTAARVGSGWVLFLEDDIDVCARFLDSVGAWLDEHARADRRLYAFGAAYAQIAESAQRGATAWDYPVPAFYGTQAFAVSHDDAIGIADWLEAHCFDRTIDGTAYDLLLHDWAATQGLEHFLASVPSFVQHIGRESVIRPRARTHTFETWPGRDWVYQPKEQTIS